MIPKRLLLMASIAALCLTPHLSSAAADLTDAQKSKAVYEMYAEYRRDFPRVADISAQDARRAFSKGGVQFIDVRKPEEIRISTLPGSVAKERFVENTERYKDKTVVAFCTIGYRSGIFAQEMAGQGIRVLNLKGGILAWVLEGGPVFDDSGASKRLHVYGPKWDLAPGDFETIKFGVLKRLKR